jgi:peptidoglycan/LPS O-acetylase OafA/YrhL
MDKQQLSDRDLHPRSQALDGLRGFAALAVVFYHGILHYDLSLIDRVLVAPLQNATSGRDVLTKIALTLQHGGAAVVIFFVLSGAVLRLSLDRRKNEPVFVTAIAFAGARALRLYPPLVACLLLFFALGYAGITGYPIFPVQVLVNNAWLYNTAMHGPSTTLQAELLAVPFILTAWLVRRWFGLPGLVLAFICSVLAYEMPALVFHLPNMHGYLVAFMAGMLAAEPALRALYERVPPESWWVALATVLMCQLVARLGSSTAAIGTAIGAGLLVSGLLYGKPGSLARILNRPAAQFLGKISFSLYLLNVPMLYVIWTFTDRIAWPKTHALEAGLLTGVASLVLTIPFAVASERWIERPSVNAGKRFTRMVTRCFRRNPGPAAAPRTVL